MHFLNHISVEITKWVSIKPDWDGIPGMILARSVILEGPFCKNIL